LDENSGRKIISGAKFVKKYKIFGYIRCPYIKEKFMNFQQLSTFCKVVAERSMTAAAQKLYLTQPAVSQQIRALEEDLNVELFVRGSRTMKPTPQGQLLYDYSQKILSLIEQSKVAIQTMGLEVSGPLRIGTINSIGLHLIGPVFSLFLKSNKNVKVQLHYSSGIDLLKKLEKGELDLAVLPDISREYGTSAEEFQSELISKDEMWLVTAGSDREAPSSTSLHEYSRNPVIQLTEQFPGFENQVAREVKRVGGHLRPVFESSNVGTLKRMIESGLGWGFLPRHSIRKQVQTGRLRRIEVDGFSYSVDLHCYWPRNQVTSKATEVFVKALHQQSMSL
jgi:DNA-binding transcriptional LysR family regulator